MNSMTALAHRRAILCGRYCPRSPDRNFVAPYTYLTRGHRGDLQPSYTRALLLSPTRSLTGRYGPLSPAIPVTVLRGRQYGLPASLQVPHCHLAIGILDLDQFCSPHRGEHRVSAGLGLAIEKDLEFSPLAVLVHLLQSFSASRFPVDAAGLLDLTRHANGPICMASRDRFDTKRVDDPL